MNDSIHVVLQAVEETGKRFRETILALGGGKAPLDVRNIPYHFCANTACFSVLHFFLNVKGQY